MNDPEQPRPTSSADNPAAIAPAEAGRAGLRRKRCAHCGRPFGLVRRRRAGMQFCSVACVNAQAEDAREAGRERRRWLEFLTARG